MAAGKKPNRQEKNMLRKAGKDPADWLLLKKYPDHYLFRHRLQEKKEIEISTQ
jgi:hypothetical protein